MNLKKHTQKRKKLNISSSFLREPSITTPISGATEIPITLPEAGLGLTHKKPSYRPTGTHPSPKSASV